jgi:Na+/H+ antiporter NhaD/arsenite permease-like protein
MNEAIISAIIFIITIALIVSRTVDEAVAGLIGSLLMVSFLKSYTPLKAFNSIDWDVIGILLGMWIFAGYSVETGLIDKTVSFLIRRVRSYRKLIALLSMLSGLLSTFLDNVLVILLLGEITIETAKRFRKDPIPAFLLIAFSANFMGTALLLGDIPPQLLHAVAGYEFLDFIIFKGRPGSFPLLTLTFIIVMAAYMSLFVKDDHQSLDSPALKVDMRYEGYRTMAYVTLILFILTIFAMSIRPKLKVPLGFISLGGASVLAFIGELLRRYTRNRQGAPSFEDVCIKRIEWRAILFYITLFIVTGGLKVSGALDKVVNFFIADKTYNIYEGFSLFYWLSATLSTVIEHDSIVLALLYMAKDFAFKTRIPTWPLYWGTVWGATLASNLTAAAAPALYVAFSIAERGGYKIRPKTFFKYSGFFVTLSLIIQYVLAYVLFL